MIFRRVFTAFLGIPVVIFIILGTNELWFFLFLLIVATLALREFLSMALTEDGTWGKRIGIFLGCGVLFSALLDSRTYAGDGLDPLFFTTGFCILSIFILFFYHISFGLSKKNALNQLVIKGFGIIYIPLLLSFAILLRAHHDGAMFLVLLLSVTWAGDTGAFFIGSWIGKHALCPEVSPKKTIEGAVTGFVSGTTVSFLFCTFFFEQVGILHSIALGMGINVMNQFGDLSESMIKRTFGVKDSGSLLPGHGGILDRIDSLIFAIPFLFYYINVVLP